MNPFKYGCIVDGDDFCARKELSAQLLDYVQRGQNIVIQGERRIGKSSLVYNTLNGQKKYRPIMIDLMGVKSTVDICNRIADALTRFDSSDGFFRRTMSLLAHLRPIMTVDTMTGMPTISVDRSAGAAPESLAVAMNAIASHVEDKNACVVLDEFQDVADLKDGDQILAIMRGKIQYMNKTSFIFLGSARNRMADIFMLPDSPFYKSALAFEVGEMPTDDFYRFLASRFSTGNRKLPRALFDKMWDAVSHITGDIQELCDAVWQVSVEGSTLDEDMLQKALVVIFAREGAAYQMFVKQLTDIQFRVLKALAIGGGEHPNSAAFLELAHVNVHASVTRALHSLSSAGLIYSMEGRYRFASPFFKTWLAMQR